MQGVAPGTFVMTGGIGLEGDNKNRLLKDLWLFNTEELKWTLVDPVNGPLRGFCDAWLCLHENRVYILGGLADELDTWNEQISLI